MSFVEVFREKSWNSSGWATWNDPFDQRRIHDDSYLELITLHKLVMDKVTATSSSLSQ
ncbi:14281_t:CDS:2, partial [Acaulospora morrowiae]